MSATTFTTSWQRWYYRLVLILMAFTGIGQLPLYPRYRLSSLPGMGWAADFYLLHNLHYVGAALLLLFLGYFVGRWFAQWREHHEIAPWGWIRLGFWAVLIGTGALRVVKNIPDVHFGTLTTVLIDWVHLAAAMFLGIAALIAMWRGRKSYVTEK